MIKTTETEGRRAENEELVGKFRELKAREESIAAVDADHRDSTSTRDAKEDEKWAAVDTTALLPLRLDASVGLQFIPPEKRERYVREMDGGFRLQFIWPSEMSDYLRSAPHAKAMENRALMTIAEGKTPLLLRQEAENGRAAAKAILDVVNKREADARAAREQAARERLEKEIARHNQAVWNSRTV